MLAIDGFGDRDLVESRPPLVMHRVVSPFDVAAIDPVSVPAELVAYTSNVENFPDALAALARGRTVLGNPPDVLRQARDPRRVASVLDDAGLPAATVHADPAAAARSRLPFLVKPLRGGGGNGIRHWEAGTPVHDGEYLQEFIEGDVGSLIFLADGRNIRTLGLTRQLCGDPAFGASGFRWCGNLLGSAGRPVLPRADEVLASAEAAAGALTAAFGLRGINGLDFVARNGVAVPIEVNPRWTGAVDLAERLFGRTLFGAHAEACEGRLPASEPFRGNRVIGKAVVFARRSCLAPDTDAWLAGADIRDVPVSGTIVPGGAPICTVLAEGSSADQCHAALASRAGEILSQCEVPAHAA